MGRSLVHGLLTVFMVTSSVNGHVVHAIGAAGQEFSATAQGGSGAVDVEGTLLLPPTAGPVRAIITVLRWGVGTWVYDDPAWRQLAEDLHCGFLRLVVATMPGRQTRWSYRSLNKPCELPPLEERRQFSRC